MEGDQKKKVLVIDDEEMHLAATELYLKDDYEVFKAKSGDEAFQYITSGGLLPSVILLDIMMPNMDGWKVFNKIRGIEKLRNVPIVFLTSVEADLNQEKALQIGIADYIVKPYNITELKNRIKDIIAKYESKV